MVAPSRGVQAVAMARSVDRRYQLVPLPHGSHRPRRSVPIAAIAVALAAAAVVAATATEILSQCVRQWTVEHPLTIGVATGAAFLVLTVLGVERWLTYTESRRWAMPAREALNTWLFAGDAAVQAIGTHILEAAPAEPDVAAAIIRLAETDPDQLRAVSDFARERAEHAAMVAMSASVVVARHKSLSGAATLMFEDLRRFDELADTCRGLAWASPLLTGAKRAKVIGLAHEWADQISEALESISGDLTHLRLYVMESRDEA